MKGGDANAGRVLAFTRQGSEVQSLLRPFPGMQLGMQIRPSA